MMANHQVTEASSQYLAEAAGQVVPVGYKQTEVGVFPKDWDVACIGDFCISYSGGTPSTSNKAFYGGNIPWITSSDLNKSRIFEVTGRITDIGLCNSSAKMVNEGTFLIALYGATAGVCAITMLSSAINQAILAVIPRKGDSEFLYYWFSSRKADIIDTYTQGGQPNLSGDIIRSITLALPSIDEQTAIANALSDVDALINELEKLIAKKQAIKTATLQQLLTGRTRLPPFALREDGTQKGNKPSELGEIPVDWDVKTIGQLCSYQNGTAQESLFNPHGGYKVISIGNYTEDGKYIPSESYISTTLKTVVGKFVLNAGDLAMILNDKTSIGTIIGRVILIDADDSYVMNQRTMRLVSKGEVKSSYLHKLINSNFIHKEIVGLAKPGTQIYVNTDDVLNLELPYPQNEEEQTAIATILSDMEADIQTLQQRLSKTRQIKQGMMQELLTGKTRLLSRKSEVGHAC